jgi:type I restriction enzyme, S subunit
MNFLGNELPVTFSNFVKRLRLDTSRLDPQFAAYFWASLYRQGRTRPYEKRTTGIRNFKLADFLKNEQLLIPPLEEQQVISSVLQAMQRARESTDDVIAASRELERSVMRHVFTYGPVTVREAEDVELQETEIGPMPRHWEVVPLGTVATISTGTTPSTAESTYWSGTTPFIKTAEIANNEIRSAKSHVTDKAVRDYRLKLYPPGTVFVAMYGQGKTRGQVAILRVAAATSQNTGAIVAGASLNPEFLWLYLLSRYEHLRSSGIHGHISHLNAGYLKQVLIPVPPVHEQHTIAEVLLAAHMKLSVEQARAQALSSVFESSLSELVSGRRRVVAEAIHA